LHLLDFLLKISFDDVELGSIGRSIFTEIRARSDVVLLNKSDPVAFIKGMKNENFAENNMGPAGFAVGCSNPAFRRQLSDYPWY
jgi:hypothetical protein